MKKFYETRWPFIENNVRGKIVLDIGPAELMGTLNRFKLEGSIHERISIAAKRVVGLEKNAEQLAPLRELGYDIREGDAERFDLKECFDVVVAGELIEHLSNPGSFLDCVQKHLKPDGVFLLTTPNRFSAPEFIAAILHNRITSYNKPIAKHVAFYDENCLQDLLVRHGFTFINVAYYEWVGKPSSNFKTRVLNAFLRRFRPCFLAGLMIAAQANHKFCP